MIIDCFAQRLLNPFRGAMHTVRYDAAEAVTVDGAHWDIYVTDDKLLEGLERAPHAQVGEIRYGSWSAAHGLRRGPRSPSVDFRRMEATGAELFEQLPSLHRELPFSFKDEYELWLLDADAQPLALLDSAVGENDMALDAGIEWRAGFAARERFTSAVFNQSIGADSGAANAGDYLTHYINRCAGARPAAQWFRRHGDGHGTGLAGIGLAPAHIGRSVPGGAFPALLLSVLGHDALHRRLIEEFQAWQAVWLLVLPGLDAALREALEYEARRQVQLVEHQYRLYPELINETAITAARVEARLRRDNSPATAADEPLPAFYIELGAYFSK